MNRQKIKQFVVMLMLALGFVIAPSFSTLSAVEAKSKKDKYHKENRYDRGRHHDDDHDEWRRRDHYRHNWWLRNHRYGRYHRGFFYRF